MLRRFHGFKVAAGFFSFLISTPIASLSTKSCVGEQILPSNVWYFPGRKRGKTVTILGGVHGNELMGTKVVLWLENLLKETEATINIEFRGNLFLGIGNPRAVSIGKRASTVSSDLNRCFEVPPTGNPKSYEEERACELVPILQQTDTLLDIHATNKPSPVVAKLPNMI